MYRQEKLVRLACLFVAYGMYGVGLEDSERMRCVGPFRYKVPPTTTVTRRSQLAMISTIARLRSFKCDVAWQAAASTTAASECRHECTTCADDGTQSATVSQPLVAKGAPVDEGVHGANIVNMQCIGGSSTSPPCTVQ